MNFNLWGNKKVFDHRRRMKNWLWSARGNFAFLENALVLWKAKMAFATEGIYPLLGISAILSLCTDMASLFSVSFVCTGGWNVSKWESPALSLFSHRVDRDRVYR